MTKRIYLDCDGVLADFDLQFETKMGMSGQDFEDKYGAKAFWDAIQNDFEGGFFRTLPLMEDAMELFAAVEHKRPIILTGCPKGGWAEMQKIEWAREFFPGIPMIVCRSINKRDYCNPGDVLVDDITKYKHLWEAAGGEYIVHTSARESIAEMKEKAII